jgi:hypothetical protein
MLSICDYAQLWLWKGWIRDLLHIGNPASVEILLTSDTEQVTLASDRQSV